MNDRERELRPEIESRWREWANSESAIDEVRLKRNLLQRIPDGRRRATGRLVLVAAAVSLLAVIIGVETGHEPRTTENVGRAVIHETGPNVILVLREGAEPIYVATETRIEQTGEK
jgi:hypothetical protein